MWFDGERERGEGFLTFVSLFCESDSNDSKFNFI